MKKKISAVTLGCSKNEVDTELLLGSLDFDKYEIVDNLEDSQIIVVNTCGFIEDAKEESIDTIWEMTKYKEENCEYLILAGCLAQRYSKELMEEIQEVDGIIGTGNIRDINTLLDQLEEKKGNKVIKIDNIDSEYLEEVNRINFSTTAYVRISEGCDNLCTYCIIPKLRGKHRSRKYEDIIKEVHNLVDNGVQEIILIAQNTSDYGIDLYGEYSLFKLLDKLNEIEKLKWIRILYLYPDNFNNHLIQSIKNGDKVLKYVDIPLQHINDNILKTMGRRTCKKDIITLINKLRSEIPNIIIRTTFIVGFPGETEEEFKELYDFIKEVKFDRLGVFTYSKEEDTPAFNLPNHIAKEVKESRRDMIMELQKNISEDKMREKIGEIYEVLIEEQADEHIYVGRTYMDSPEIDGVVYVNSTKELEAGKFVLVKILEYLEYDLIGDVENEPTK